MLKFNTDRPKPGDDEIEKRKDFNALVEQFKKQSLKKARGDESWRGSKSLRYTAVILGITVVCTVTYAIFNKQDQKPTHEKINTQATTNTTSKKPFIAPPSPKLKPAYARYTVNNGKGGTIAHGATKIKIEPGSFVNKKGVDIRGDITIEYKEMHDIGDVIANGIPMAYDSAGIGFNLETAGMFDIRGTQNGEPVYIRHDKPVQVQLASHNNEDRFNQYFLDTLARNWQYLQRDNAIDLSPAPQPRSRPTTRNQADIQVATAAANDSLRTTYLKRIEKLPTVADPPRPVKSNAGRPSFKLDGSYDEFPELAAFENVLFEVGPENKNYSPKFHDITWSDVKISQGPVKGKNYVLQLKYRGVVEKLIVYPVLTGQDYEKAKQRYDEQLSRYETLRQKRQEEEKELMAEMEAKQAAYMAQMQKQRDEEKKRARVPVGELEVNNELAANFDAMSNKARATRIFSVTRFGIYNSDCPHSVEGGTNINPVFSASDKGKPIFPDAVYLVDHVKKTVYTIDPREGLTFNLNPAGVYSACIFVRSTMYLCNKTAFGETISKGGNIFSVLPLPAGADNLADFKKALEI